MLAHGFTVEMMTALAREGLVTVTAWRMVAGGRDGKWRCYKSPRRGDGCSAASRYDAAQETHV